MREGRFRSKNEVKLSLARASAKLSAPIGMLKLYSINLQDAAEVVPDIIDVSRRSISGDDHQRNPETLTGNRPRAEPESSEAHDRTSLPSRPT